MKRCGRELLRGRPALVPRHFQLVQEIVCCGSNDESLRVGLKPHSRLSKQTSVLTWVGVWLVHDSVWLIAPGADKELNWLLQPRVADSDCTCARPLFFKTASTVAILRGSESAVNRIRDTERNDVSTPLGTPVLMRSAVLWGTLLGGIAYSHVVCFPVFLSDLPDSAAVVHGPYGLHEEVFWMSIHPVTILSLIAAVAFNWKWRPRRLLMVRPSRCTWW
jgi:hypothetical protein